MRMHRLFNQARKFRHRRHAAAMLAVISCTVTPAAAGVGRPPDILLVSVDTLRADHMSGYGYGRDTSPNIDRLMADGVRFTEARTVVPLTCPALGSMLTTLEPHIHGSTRNGIQVRPGLESFPKVFADAGYQTAAFVANWALQDRLCGLSEHFQVWREVLERRRWLFSRREADAADLTDDAVAWLEGFARRPGRPPLLLWVHYMDPHSLYILHEQYLDQLDLAGGAAFFSASRRYDTEIAHADHHIARLLAAADELLDPANTVILFTSDHGESLGDHGYWGHGRHVYENVLRIPLSITWRGHLEPATLEASALIVDIAPTLLSLAGVGGEHAFAGFDWAPILRRDAAGPEGRITYFQGHRGTVDPKEDPGNLRRKGLLEVGRVQGTTKEVYVVRKGERRVFDVASDPQEQHSLVAPDSEVSEALQAWHEEVEAWLERSGDAPPPEISEEDLEKLRALGYLE